MIVFEDKEDSMLSNLFARAYPDKISKKFKFSNGNGGLVDKVTGLLEETDEAIYVFMDAIPDNINIKTIYNQLKDISKSNNFRVVVLSIVCAEYYFIKAFKDTNILSSIDGLEYIWNFTDYRESRLLSDIQSREFVKNFEKYCKLVLSKDFTDCARVSRNENHDNMLYGYFYEKDCLCECSMLNCVSWYLVDKATKYTKEYPCIPLGAIKDKRTPLTDEEVWRMHRNLIDAHNERVDTYVRLGIVPEGRVGRYKLTYIK